MSNSLRQTAPHEVSQGTCLVLYACLPVSLGEAADHSVASTPVEATDSTALRRTAA